MSTKIRKSAVLAWSSFLLTMMTVAACGADKESLITWKKTVVKGRFRSEGVAVADVNKDGKLDVLVGHSWYEAPPGPSTTAADRTTTATASWAMSRPI
jgi:hypothetical protein